MSGSYGRARDIATKICIKEETTLRYRECEISWVQFRNWLRKNDPENEATATENEAGDNNMEIKKEGKGPMPPKGPEPIPKKNPGETGEVPTPTKTMKPKAPELQTPPKTKKPKNQAQANKIYASNANKDNHPPGN